MVKPSHTNHIHRDTRSRLVLSCVVRFVTELPGVVTARSFYQQRSPDTST